MSELATGMPKAGGSYYFISRSMGPAFGTVIGLGTWLSLVFKGSFALIGLAEYLKIMFPIPVLLTAIVSGIILLLINYRGTEGSGSLQNAIVIGLFLVLILFIFRGSFSVTKANFFPFMPNGFSSIFSTTGLIFVSYLGITQLAAVSEEVIDPDRNLPKAFILSVIAVTLLYIGIILIVTGVLPLERLIDNDTPLVDVADIFAGRWGQYAIIIAGFFATVSTANAAVLSSSRFPFAMGRDKLMPKLFTVIHKKYKTPYRAITVTGLTMLFLLLIFNVEQLASLASTFNVIIFVLINTAVIILRISNEEWYKPGFKDPFYPFTQVVGIIGCLSLIPYLGTLSLFFAVGVIVLGLLWYSFYAGKDKALPRYNLLDMIESTTVPVFGEDLIKCLIPIANPDHENDLHRLANFLGDYIIGLHVRRVPFQTDLETIRQAYDDENGINDERMLRFESQFKVKKKEKKYIEVYSRNIADAILEQAKNEDVDILLLGWHRYENNFPLVNENISKKIIKNANSNLAILKGRFPEKIKNIIVPFSERDNSHYALYLAKRIADSTGAVIKLLRIIKPETEEEKREEIRRQLEKEIKKENCCQIKYEIRERYSRVDAIVAANKEYDLMIMGDRNKRFVLEPFGDVAQRVAKIAEKPFILVKKFSPISTRGIRAKLNK